MHFKHTSTRYMQRNSLWLSDYILKCQTACCYLRTCNSILSQGIRGQLILHKTGFPCWKFVTSNFVEVQVFSRIFTFYIVFDNLFLNWLSTGENENQVPRFHRNYIIAREQKHDEHGASDQSSLKITSFSNQDLVAYNESLQHLTSLLFSLRFFIFFYHWSIHLFQSDNCFQAIGFVEWPFLEKLDIFRINLS